MIRGRSGPALGNVEVVGDGAVLVEDDEAIEVTVGDPLLKAYERTLATFLADAREFCGRRGLNYLFIDNGTPVERVVVDLLRRQGLVR